MKFDNEDIKIQILFTYNIFLDSSTERVHRNRLAGSIGNLNSSLISNNSFDVARNTAFPDDELSSKIKAELDRSIAKHLEMLGI